MDDSRRSLTVAETLAALKAEIWRRRPILGEIMQRHGEKILNDYTKDFLDVNPAPALDARKHECIDAVAALAGERLGAEVGDGVRAQLERLALVSTADHHAPLTHPFWVNANLITALPGFDRPDLDIRYLIVLSFASVSLNNASGFPRGVQFYGGVGGSENILRIPLLPDKLKMGVVYRTRAFARPDLERARIELEKRVSEGRLAADRYPQIWSLIEQDFAAPEVLGAADLSSQITQINYRLWRRLFHPPVGEAPGPDTPRLPDLLYLDIETLVTNLLVQYHLDRPDSLIWKFLFSTDYRPLVREHFNGIPGAFHLEKGWGTYLFWGVDDHHHRIRLALEGEELVSKDGTMRIPYTPQVITKALREGRVYPSMLTCYLLISLYYGMKCLGGFCQVNDLTYTKQAWQKLLRAVGEGDEADAIEPVQTKELGGDGMVLAYIRSADEHLLPASSFDMILNPRDTSLQRYIDRSRHVTLTEMMHPMLPEMYTVLYTSEERKPELLQKSLEQIVVETGLQEKLLGMNK